MKQFIRLFLWIIIPILLWVTRHQTQYPSGFTIADMLQLPAQQFKLHVDDYSPEDVQWAKQFLRDSMALPSHINAEQTMQLISRYLIQTLHPQMHEASTELLKASPREQFMQIRYGKASFYCSNYVALYGFFARVAGLAVRDIELKSSTRWHIVSETWNPINKRWMLNDLTHQLTLVYNNQHQPLSLFDPNLLTFLPSAVQADYHPNAQRLVHLKNNALQLISLQHKLTSFLFSQANIVPVLNHLPNPLWPIVLKYIGMVVWLFLSIRFLRGLV